MLLLKPQTRGSVDRVDADLVVGQFEHRNVDALLRCEHFEVPDHFDAGREHGAHVAVG